MMERFYGIYEMRMGIQQNCWIIISQKKWVRKENIEFPISMCDEKKMTNSEIMNISSKAGFLLLSGGAESFIIEGTVEYVREALGLELFVVSLLR